MAVAAGPEHEKRKDYSMEDKVQIFDNPNFGKLRITVGEDGTKWIVAKDVAESLSYTKASQITRLLSDDEKGVQTLHTPGGYQCLSVINEQGFYRAILFRRSQWVKDPDKCAAVESFQRWVTHEVLPSIRKSGGYMVAVPDETPEQLMARALKVADDTLARMHAQLDEVQAANAALAGKVEDMQSKALFADAVASSDRCILIGELAKMLRQNGYPTGQNRLYQTLREDGYLMKSGDSYNRPTQRAMELGLFVVIERTIIDGRGGSKTTATTKVTGKGQQYFVNRYCPRKFDFEAAL